MKKDAFEMVVEMILKTNIRDALRRNYPEYANLDGDLSDYDPGTGMARLTLDDSGSLIEFDCLIFDGVKIQLTRRNR